MARPRKNTSKSGKTTKVNKTAPVTEVVIEETVVETPVADAVPEEVKAETPVEVEEVKDETVAVEAPAEEVKPEESVAEIPDESKPKRKYTRRAKTEEATPVAEAPAEKKASKSTRKTAPEVNAYIQGAGSEKSIEALAETAKKLSGVKSPKSVNLYIKPYEDDGVAKVYYVVDDKADWFELF